MANEILSSNVNTEAISEFLTLRYIEYFLNGSIPSELPISSYLSLPKLGDHLVTPRRGYTHHGIYSGEKRVIHYSGLADGLNSGPVEEVSLDIFCSGQPYEIKSHPKRKFTREEIVNNALKRISEKSYNIVYNNCEHFVNKCIYGINTSQQVGAVIKTAAHASLKVAGQSSPVTTAVTAIAYTGQHIVSYIKGDIEKEKLFEEINHTAITTTSTLYYAGLGQAAIPIPVVGALIGASTGFFIGNMLHKSGLTALGDSRVIKEAKKRRLEIEALCEKLVPKLQESREELEKYVDTYFLDRKQKFIKSFKLLDLSLKQWDPDSYVLALEEINNQFGKTLQFKTFEEFDIFMESDEAFEF